MEIITVRSSLSWNGGDVCKALLLALIAGGVYCGLQATGTLPAGPSTS